MKQRKLIWLGFFVVLILVVVVSARRLAGFIVNNFYAGTVTLAESTKRVPANLGTSLVTLDGRTVNLTGQQGKVILLNFWHPS